MGRVDCLGYEYGCTQQSLFKFDLMTFSIFDSVQVCVACRLRYCIVSYVLEYCGSWGVRMIFKMQEYSLLQHFVFLVKDILRVGVGSNDGAWGSFEEMCAVEQWDECLGGVSVGSKAGKEVAEVGEFVCRIRAEGVDSVAIANDQSREDSGGMGGVRRDIQVQVQFLFKQHGMYCIVF